MRRRILRWALHIASALLVIAGLVDVATVAESAAPRALLGAYRADGLGGPPHLPTTRRPFSPLLARRSLAALIVSVGAVVFAVAIGVSAARHAAPRGTVFGRREPATDERRPLLDTPLVVIGASSVSSSRPPEALAAAAATDDDDDDDD
eukprot:CAMPEP_0185699720 /NCGR_PEP_ID=MMETSP1164-20130828/7089_1 /TAXON_ID=1104430 /ORGANISM="Chrysoreinhardia sp, Strain CCMP2950" /LENGTH=148 /DNA_ID=CAMNT_0028366663 /DNA_START=50 /DNA_END=493 /DNA_ORIENTATION=+